MNKFEKTGGELVVEGRGGAKKISGEHLRLLEYQLREEKDTNCDKLNCCGRKSCAICEIFLAAFSSHNLFFPQQFLPVKYVVLDYTLSRLFYLFQIYTCIPKPKWAQHWKAKRYKVYSGKRLFWHYRLQLSFVYESVSQIFFNLFCSGDKRLLSEFFRIWGSFHRHNERFFKYIG